MSQPVHYPSIIGHCNICEIPFHCEKMFMKHMVNHYPNQFRLVPPKPVLPPPPPPVISNPTLRSLLDAPTPKSFVCQVCGECFQFVVELQRHSQTHTVANKSIPCGCLAVPCVHSLGLASSNLISTLQNGGTFESLSPEDKNQLKLLPVHMQGDSRETTRHKISLLYQVYSAMNSINCSNSPLQPAANNSTK